MMGINNKILLKVMKYKKNSLMPINKRQQIHKSPTEKKTIYLKNNYRKTKNISNKNIVMIKIVIS